MIGLSVYPSWYATANDWQNCNKDCLANMNDMVNRYGKEVMIVECGMSWDMPDTCKSFLTDLITKTKSVTANKGLGVFYWEPECNNNWSGYSLGAFDNSGKPTLALNAFSLGTESISEKINPLVVYWNKQSQTISFNEQIATASLFDIRGKIITQRTNSNSIKTISLPKGIYIVKAKRFNSTEIVIRKITVS